MAGCAISSSSSSAWSPRRSPSARSCCVDDARLVVANAVDAAERGARILVGTECLLARRDGALWHAALSGGVEVRARAIVNAAGPWVKDVLNQRLGQPSRDAVRLVKG